MRTTANHFESINQYHIIIECCGEKFSVQWKVRRAVKISLYSEEFTVQWQVYCAVKSSLCSEEFTVQWRIHCAVKSSLCSEEFTVQWRVHFGVKSSLCSVMYDVQLRVKYAVKSRPAKKHFFLQKQKHAGNKIDPKKRINCNQITLIPELLLKIPQKAKKCQNFTTICHTVFYFFIYVEEYSV